MLAYISAHAAARPTIRADQFFTVAGDSSRRLPENRRKIGDWSRLLQPHFEKLIGPGPTIGRIDKSRLDRYR